VGAKSQVDAHGASARPYLNGTPPVPGRFVKLDAPTLSDLDRSWTDEPERSAFAEGSIADGTPTQFPPPPSLFPTASIMLPATAIAPPPPRVRKLRDHNDSTLIVRPRRDSILRPAARERRWVIAGVSVIALAVATIVVTLWPARADQPTAAAGVAAAVEPATAAVAPPVIAKPATRVATAAPVAKKPIAKKPIVKKPLAKPATKVAAKPVAKAKPVAAKKPAPKKPIAKPAAKHA